MDYVSGTKIETEELEGPEHRMVQDLRLEKHVPLGNVAVVVAVGTDDDKARLAEDVREVNCAVVHDHEGENDAEEERVECWRENPYRDQRLSHPQVVQEVQNHRHGREGDDRRVVSNKNFLGKFRIVLGNVVGDQQRGRWCEGDQDAFPRIPG